MAEPRVLIAKYLRWLPWCWCSPPLPLADIPILGKLRIPRVSTLHVSKSPHHEPSPAWKNGWQKRTVPSARTERRRAGIRTHRSLFRIRLENLYAIYICFDREPQRRRARLSRREDVFDDAFVELMLDTFNDHRHAYAFLCEPARSAGRCIVDRSPGTIVRFRQCRLTPSGNSAGRVLTADT